MKSISGFGRIAGRTCAQAAVGWILAGIGTACAAGPGFEGRVFGVDEAGKLLGTVPGAAIELKGGGSTAADGAGRYRIDVAPGTYAYKLTAAGYKDEDSGRGVQLQLSEGYAVFNFTLTKGKTDPDKKPKPQAEVKAGRLKGRVYEKTSKGERGIGGAVIALRRSADRQLTRVVTRGGGRTGVGAGGYEVGLKEGEWRASVSAEGFRQFVDPKPIQVPGDGEATRDFVLQREDETAEQGLDITVRVIPGDGKPVAFPDVRVGITRLPGDELVGRETPPDGKGHLRSPLPAGRYHAYAEADGFPTAHSRPTFVFSGRYSRIVLTLERKPRQTQPEPVGGLVVLVTDASTKRPLPGAAVLARAGQQALADAARGTTGPNGEAGFDGASPGDYAIMARLDGYRPGGDKIAIMPGKRHRVFIALVPDRVTTIPPVTPEPEPVPPVPGYTRAPVAKTQCPVVRTECPVAATKCPPTPTQCPVVPNQCPRPLETRDPVAQTHCPVMQTRCPVMTTRCPPTPTRCQDAPTQCPSVPTQCPVVPNQCPRPLETRDPMAQTHCPVMQTRCPVMTTRCPPTQTQCRGEKTQCPVMRTQCPPVRTQCPTCAPDGMVDIPGTIVPFPTRQPVAKTRCPSVQTQCPQVTTKCPPCRGTAVPPLNYQPPATFQPPVQKTPMMPLSAPTRMPMVQTRCPAVKTQCPPCK